MPNWCNNSLQLTAASKEEANELYQHFEKQGEDDWTFFGFFVPETWDEDNWYWSRVEAWGTKWDASISSIDWVDDYTVCMTFDTAWSPPIATYEAMMEQGWGVSATYSEPGMCFVGSWLDGMDEHYDYSQCEDPEAVRDLIGADLDDEYGVSYWMEQMIEEEKAYEDEQREVQESKASEQNNREFSSEDSGVEYFGKA